jgi:hypothetical protein
MVTLDRLTVDAGPQGLAERVKPHPFGSQRRSLVARVGQLLPASGLGRGGARQAEWVATCELVTVWSAATSTRRRGHVVPNPRPTPKNAGSETPVAPAPLQGLYPHCQGADLPQRPYMRLKKSRYSPCNLLGKSRQRRPLWRPAPFQSRGFADQARFFEQRCARSNTGQIFLTFEPLRPMSDLTGPPQRSPCLSQGSAFPDSLRRAKLTVRLLGHPVNVGL